MTLSWITTILFYACWFLPKENYYASALLNHDYTSSSREIFIAFYNVENLFDTVDAPGIDDAEFLPNGKNHWTSAKYHAKINHIAKVVKAMNDGKGADLVGLAEVE